MRRTSALRVALETAPRHRPVGERKPVDFRVVADVHREFFAKIESFDFGRVFMLQRKYAQFAGQRAPSRGIADRGFHHDRRPLPSANPEPDERATRRAWMEPKNLFAWLRMQCAGRRLNALRFAAAEPEPALGIEITAVAHAMPCAAGGPEIGNFRERR